MRLAIREKALDVSASMPSAAGIAMPLETSIIERVETFVRHPVFAGSDKALGLVLEDLEMMVEDDRLHPATYRRLREMILESPHFARDN